MTRRILPLLDAVAAGTATTKSGAIREVGDLLVSAGAVLPDYVESMFEREASVSTYMGNFLAIPHGTNEARGSIVRSALSFVRYADPIEWDGQQVRFVIGIAGLDSEHLEILQQIAAVFSDVNQVQKLIDADTPAEILRILSGESSEFSIGL
ncbi:PTS sugar transporter subunit IIA [Cryobacterium cryoconiti]|uniref:Mannitol-specific phosphotransferase enzyme IIA component n=1 Tax=Cryobacterium cryoconiti TaxID=1259239 RepID=A0A4Y8K103_9MICO|nr:PTS sugar transporter subunit IIA [Cryobacterium cryoconiti]TFD30573.1 PTS mannitol transporter subunit IIA [Cryobacterium cryoconiti]